MRRTHIRDLTDRFENLEKRVSSFEDYNRDNFDGDLGCLHAKQVVAPNVTIPELLA